MNATATAQPPVRKKALLDIRDLAPPEPMRCVLGNLAVLPPKTTLVTRFRGEPDLLYEMIDADDWQRSGRQLVPGHWQVFIWRPEDAF